VQFSNIALSPAATSGAKHILFRPFPSSTPSWKNKVSNSRLSSDFKALNKLRPAEKPDDFYVKIK
jgi:hypothetical protein